MMTTKWSTAHLLDVGRDLMKCMHISIRKLEFYMNIGVTYVYRFYCIYESIK